MSAAQQPAERMAPQPWMGDTATRAVLRALAREGGAARFVGGCVRDALLGRAVKDIDIATPLVPEEVMRRLEAARIKAVPTGLMHGTVTAVVPPRHFEITTLRRDVETFGRHARVAFTDDWAADARRRDFTMNALFLDAEGNVFDPVGGLGDLRASARTCCASCASIASTRITGAVPPTPMRAPPAARWPRSCRRCRASASPRRC